MNKKLNLILMPTWLETGDQSEQSQINLTDYMNAACKVFDTGIHNDAHNGNEN